MLTNENGTIKYYSESELTGKDRDFFKLISSGRSLSSTLKFMKDNPSYEINKCKMILTADNTTCTVINPVLTLIENNAGSNLNEFFELLNIINKRASPDLFVFKPCLMLYEEGESDGLNYKKICFNNKDIVSVLLESTIHSYNESEKLLDIFKKKIDTLYESYAFLKIQCNLNEILYDDIFYKKDKSNKERFFFESLIDIISSSEQERNFLQMACYASTYNYTALNKTQLKNFRTYIEKKDFFDYARLPHPHNFLKERNNGFFTFLYQVNEPLIIEEILLKKKKSPEFESFKEKLCMEFLTLLKSENVNEPTTETKKRLSLVSEFLKKHHSPELFKKMYNMNVDSMLQESLEQEKRMEYKKGLQKLIIHYKNEIYPVIEKKTLTESLPVLQKTFSKKRRI